MKSNVTNLASFFMTDIQTQQGNLNGANSTTSSEKTVEFSQYMKASVSDFSEQSQKTDGNVNVTVKEDAENTEKSLKSSEFSVQESSKTQKTTQLEKTFEEEQKSSKETGEVSVEDAIELSGEAGKVIRASEELIQSLETIENDLKQKIIDGFEITEEELEEALEVLAINIYDLLQTDKLKELAVYVSGEENLVSMVTNGEMYTTYKEVATGIEELSSTLMEKFSVNPGELKEVVEQVKDILSESEITKDIVIESEDTMMFKNANLLEDTIASVSGDLAEDIRVSEEIRVSEDTMILEGETASEDAIVSKNMTVSEDNLTEVQQLAETEEDIKVEVMGETLDTTQTEIHEEVSKVVSEIAKENGSVSKEQNIESDIEQPDKLQTVGEETLTEVENSDQKQSFSDAKEQEAAKEQGVTKEKKDMSAVQTVTNYSTIAGDKEVQTIVQTQRTDFEGVVKQIVEQIKVQIRPDSTSMELQLNPENLGKVNLHISSKEGAVTAQLFVQNETVKTMIEGQLSVLREAMAQQGVKVEAVEVAVETGSFERNLEQHSEQRKQESEQQAKSYQRKQINLLAGVDEETMNEAEILKTHIMRESGNSVDMDA